MGTTEGDDLQSTEASPWMRPFVPPRLLRNAHLQTIVGNLLPRIDTLPDDVCVRTSWIGDLGAPISLFRRFSP